MKPILFSFVLFIAGLLAGLSAHLLVSPRAQATPFGFACQTRDLDAVFLPETGEMLCLDLSEGIPAREVIAQIIDRIEGSVP